jgi:hypothetical protein
MSFFDRYVPVDKKLMAEGAEIDFGEGFFVTVRHVSSEPVEVARNRITQQLKLMGRNAKLTGEQQRQITVYTAAHAGIVSWRGGDAPEFTPEVALQVFEDRPEFLEDIVTAMTTYEAFRKEEVKRAEGNSLLSSNGD